MTAVHASIDGVSTLTRSPQNLIPRDSHLFKDPTARRFPPWSVATHENCVHLANLVVQPETLDTAISTMLAAHPGSMCA